MKQWPSLERSLILGTDTSGCSLTSDQPALQTFLAQSQKLPPERQLLHSLAAYSLAQRGARPLHRLPELDPPHLMPPSQSLSASLEALLIDALNAQDLPLLTEYLTALADHQQAIPPIHWVALFDLAVQQPSLAFRLEALLDARARWLLSIRPEWQSVHAIIQQPSLEPLSGKPLALAVAELMQRDPESCLQQLQQLWPQLNAKQRQPCLDWLCQQRPRPEWRPLLEQSLTSRSLAIRRQVVLQLLALGDDALQQSIQHWLLSVLQISRSEAGKPQLQLQLPAQFDKAWEACAIQERWTKLPNGTAVGLAAGWLYQWLSLVAPSQLAQWLDLQLEQLLALFKASDYAEVLLEACQEGACVRQDLAAFWQLYTPSPRLYLPGLLSRAVDTAPPDFIAQLMQNLASCLQPKHRERWLEWLQISQRYGPLKPEQAECWCQLLLWIIPKQKVWYDSHSHSLNQLAYLMPLDFYPQALQLLQPVLTDERLQSFLVLYQKRYQFAAELQPSATAKDPNTKSSA